VSLVFIDDGVYELVKGQVTKGIGIKNFSPSLPRARRLHVEKLYVERESSNRAVDRCRLLCLSRCSTRADGRADGEAGRRAQLLKEPHAAHRQQVPTANRRTRSCLRLSQRRPALAADRGGVYAATTRSPAPESVRAAMKRVKVYALQPTSRRAACIPACSMVVTLVDYGGFVDLVAEPHHFPFVAVAPNPFIEPEPGDPA